MEANLVEVMSSIQGEGLFVGCRQIFIRFLGCNLACPYCDTPASFTASRQCRVERKAGARDFYTVENPINPAQLLQIVQNFDLANHHSLSFTGGEPLLHAAFLQEFIPLLRGKGPLAFLESNGTLPDRLQEVIDLLDIISMDIKLTGNTVWEDHARFLAIARQKTVYVKTVVLEDTSDEQIVRASELIAGEDAGITLILQPVTPYGSIRKSPGPARMLELQDLALRRLRDVRVIPQTHKIMGQL